ncbi:segregation and condensation protein A [Glacieibacterium megasporae]|uniref:segregation and condensation protein A n=1 Tax=Glacieibacterium megasporae TaxID=2835787 RepID=UPI001C1DEBE4|nr:ScpA family protein [Polymorphobacter megasporae]UAJ11577.1 segregation/condensation protein A [Polymorphobacter megasporae]
MADDFGAPVRIIPETLTLALDGWEGPLDVLLALARAQKVDLKVISILALVDQYLAFIAEARTIRLELAADYLVMAAWLAYLKSCLLLPPDPEADPDPHELALRLQFRLQRLDAMREAGARMMARDRAGHDTFRRIAPEGLRLIASNAVDCTLFDLLSAYGTIVRRRERPGYSVVRRDVLALDEALERLARLVGAARDWTDLATYLPPAPDEAYRRSALASTFLAALELTRQGRTDLAQFDAFAPVLVRAR